MKLSSICPPNVKRWCIFAGHTKFGEIDPRSLIFSLICITHLMAGRKYFFGISKGQNCHVLIHLKGVSIIQTRVMHRIWGITGQINNFRVPNLAHGPDVCCACLFTYYVTVKYCVQHQKHLRGSMVFNI